MRKLRVNGRLSPMSARWLVRWSTLSVVAVVVLGAATAQAQEVKGGEDETGPYEVVANWPQPWSKDGYIWGSQPAVFAESSNRVFIGARGETEGCRRLRRAASTGRGARW